MSGASDRVTPMRVAIIDVGSNTARLLVANVTPDGAVLPVDEARAYLRLGAEIERTGTLGRRKIEEAAATCRGFARAATALGADRVAVVVTAPGRQGAAAAEMMDALGEATSAPVRVLTAEEEGPAGL
jgi:exopolyphosphatase / guanosine-5'-triphosphate,3'-diphosphate pyrophosphatase